MRLKSKGLILCLLFLLSLIISCFKNNRDAETNLMDFLGDYQNGDILVYSYITKDGSKSEVRLKVGSDVENGGCYYRNFYVGDAGSDDLHQFSLCANVKKGELSIWEVLDFSDQELKPLFLKPFLSSSVVLLKTPISEKNQQRKKRSSGIETSSQIVQIMKDKETDELILKVLYQEGGFYWDCVLGNKRGLLELTLSTFDLKTMKPQIRRKLRLETTERHHK